LFQMSADGTYFTGGWCYKYEHPSVWNDWSGKNQRITSA
jgi:hypothetical protein